MEYNEIENLLKRYFGGESTLEEEELLKQYFNQSGLPTEQRAMQEMFRYFVMAREEVVPPFDVTAEMNAVIGKEWDKEKRSRFKVIFVWLASTAAVLVISFGIYQYTDKQKTSIQVDTFKDPKLAYLEAKRALLMVSSTMNRHTTNLKYLADVDESFNHMKKIAEIDKVVNSVKK